MHYGCWHSFFYAPFIKTSPKGTDQVEHRRHDPGEARTRWFGLFWVPTDVPALVPQAGQAEIDREAAEAEKEGGKKKNAKRKSARLQDGAGPPKAKARKGTPSSPPLERYTPLPKTSPPKGVKAEPGAPLNPSASSTSTTKEAGPPRFCSEMFGQEHGQMVGKVCVFCGVRLA